MRIGAIQPACMERKAVIMKRKALLSRMTSLVLALLIAVSAAPAAAAAGGGMGNFKKVRDFPGFSDVGPGAWYANDVRKAYELDLINGKGNGKFDPTGTLTVAEAITMGARVHAIYFGNSLTPGGSPWYANAVNYAIQAGIIKEGEYTDYTAMATRADLANLFYSLPATEFPRINRIGFISDISPDTDYFHFIYLLYGAGVLTGSETGAFQPNNPVTRAEAAAIINRAVLPESRVHTSVSTNAPGQVITGANGNFKISIPKDAGWEIATNEVDEDGWCSFGCSKTDSSGGAVLLSLLIMPKAGHEYSSTRSMIDTLAQTAAGENAVITDSDISNLFFRGWNTYYVNIDGDPFDQEILCLENSTQYYAITLYTNEACTQSLYDQLLELVYTLDIAL